MRTLEFEVRGQSINKNRDCNFDHIVSGTVGYLQAKFLFYGNEWRGCQKAASFFINGVEHAAILDSRDTCVIPKEALTGSSFSVSVTGIRNGFKIKTNKTEVIQEVI